MNELGIREEEAEKNRSPAPSFEAGIEKLEQIVKALEQRDISLENALALFKEGIGLVQHCNALLDQAEREMEVLLETDGELRTEKIVPAEG